jgi:DNA (cytosine-5)-methyltransferase 1
MPPIPIIDLFAGPGGLGEGFSSLRLNRDPAFEIQLSIEKDPTAHRTLRLRAFFRQFPGGQIPDAYHQYLAKEISIDALFEWYPVEAKAADGEAWCAELGSDEFPLKEIDRRICDSLAGARKWVLIGGPPCQAYSLVGRSRIIGGKGVAEYEADHRHFLYREYLRIIAAHQPSVFVMENVKGLLSARVGQERTFERILRDLKNPVAAMQESAIGNAEYRLYAINPREPSLPDDFEPEEFVIHAEDYGVPQARHRIIVVGVRSDIDRRPGELKRSDAVSVEEAIGDLPRLRSGLSKEADSAEGWLNAVRAAEHSDWFSNGRLNDDVKREIGMALARLSGRLGRSAERIDLRRVTGPLHHWFVDERLTSLANHESRGHMREDLHRYLFAAAFAKIKGRSPVLKEFPEELLPKHKNVGETLVSSKFNDRFRVQVADRPSTTVVSHIAKDGHYFIHYDPTQCRSLTVREAARLQTFPDNYLFEGPRTEQYKQVGNAVPPYLAYQIAEVVAGLF